MPGAMPDAHALRGGAPPAPRSELWWFEPRWSRLPRASEATAFLRRPGFWLRALVAPGCGFLLLLLALERWVPQFEADGRELLPMTLGVVVMLPAALWLVARAPELIVINRHGIHHGRRWYAPAALRRWVLDLREPARPSLWIELEPASPRPLPWLLRRLAPPAKPQRKLTLGVSRKVGPGALAASLRHLFPRAPCEVLEPTTQR